MPSQLLLLDAMRAVISSDKPVLTRTQGLALTAPLEEAAKLYEDGAETKAPQAAARAYGEAVAKLCLEGRMPLRLILNRLGAYLHVGGVRLTQKGTLVVNPPTVVHQDHLTIFQLTVNLAQDQVRDQAPELVNL